MTRHYWTAIAHGERHATVAAIRDIAGRHTSIANFQLFSDLALSLVLEVDAGHLMVLHRDLSQWLELDAPTADDGECVVMLNVTFSGADGKLRVGVPDIPNG